MNTLTSQLTDEQIQLAFTEIGCDIDINGEYGEPHRFTVTNDSLDDFITSSAQWNKCGSVKKEKNALIFLGVAPRKMDQECDLYVVNFGDIRIACKY